MVAMTFSDEPTDAPDDRKDSAPTTERLCQQCGRNPVEYSGSGRYPKYCPECKASKGSTSKPANGSGPTVRASKGDDQLALQAANALRDLNGFAAMALLFTGYTETAGVMAASEEAFHQRCYIALQSDPKLCRTILKSGGNFGAKSGLAIAYGSLLAAVVPSLVVEHRNRRAERELESGEDASAHQL